MKSLIHKFGLCHRQRFDFRELQTGSWIEIPVVQRFRVDYCMEGIMAVHVHEWTAITKASEVRVVVKSNDAGDSVQVSINSTVAPPEVLKVPLFLPGTSVDVFVVGCGASGDIKANLSIELAVQAAPSSLRMLASHLMTLADSFPLMKLFERIGAKEEIPLDALEERVHELKRYLVMAACCHQTLPMGGVVDDLWHEFILHTRDYWRFCSAIGGYVHHAPGTSDARNKWASFCACYLECFGESPPASIWPAAHVYTSSPGWWINRMSAFAREPMSADPVEEFRDDLLHLVGGWLEKGPATGDRPTVFGSDPESQ